MKNLTIIVFIGLLFIFPLSSKESTAFESTYQPSESGNIYIKDAKIFTGTGSKIEKGNILISSNKIKAIGENVMQPADARVIDANGKWVTPGIIDIHSHMGVYPAPNLRSSSDGNESTSPVTAHVWAEHSVWTQDPQMPLALKGGITTFHVLPGSANLIGGRGVTLKNVWSRTVQGMKFPGAPYTLKMACGENPKRVYGGRGTEPSTRMGNVAGYRKAWIRAQNYRNNITKYESKSDEDKELENAPSRDLELETLLGVLDGEILIQNHCYRGEEMAIMLDVAKEFNYRVTTFHHAIEAYKVADILAENEVCAAVWADWWGFKHEAFDMVWENAAIIDQAKSATGCAIIHSDSAVGIQRLNQEAAKAMAAGNRAGLNIPAARAIQWITLNPAKGLGIDEKTGSLEVGKMADIVIWDGNPFSVYTKTEKVFVDGVLLYDKDNPSTPRATDFELGIINSEEDRL